MNTKKYTPGMTFDEFLYANYGASHTRQQRLKASGDFLNLSVKTMKKIVFRVDGSTAPDSMRIIYNAVKKQFPEATKEERNLGTFTWDCYISVKSENFTEALQLVKGFASHAMGVADNKKNIQKVATGSGYDYYTGTGDKGRTFYNLVPEGQPAPAGGYYSKEHILNVKGVPDRFPATS